MGHAQTIRDAMLDGVNSRIAGSFAAVKGLISDFTTTPYTRNSLFWLRDLDTSAMDIVNPAVDAHNAAIIHPWFCWTAQHYAANSIRVFDDDGNVQEIGFSDVRNFGDISIRKLAIDVTTIGVTPFKVFGPTCLSKISRDGYGVPLVITNQFREFCIKKCAQLSTYLSVGFSTLTPTDVPVWFDFYQGVVDHDSGSPVFAVIRGQLVFIGHVGDSSAGGASAAANFAGVNAVMDAMLSGASLTEFDSSSFAALVSGSEPVGLTDITWIGGGDDPWSAENFDLNRLPTATDNVIIPDAGSQPHDPDDPTNVGGLQVSGSGSAVDLSHVRVIEDLNLNGAFALTIASYDGRVRQQNGASLTTVGVSDSGDMPAEADVRDGVQYQNEAKTGTLAVEGGGGDSGLFMME